MKKLTALFDLPELKDEIELHNMVLDSRKVKTEDLFCRNKRTSSRWKSIY